MIMILEGRAVLYRVARLGPTIGLSDFEFWSVRLGRWRPAQNYDVRHELWHKATFP